MHMNGMFLYTQALTLGLQVHPLCRLQLYPHRTVILHELL